jgi:hypothetical protein
LDTARYKVAKSPHLSTREYARIVARWVESIGLDASAYGTHAMRRTKATLIYRRTKNALVEMIGIPAAFGLLRRMRVRSILSITGIMPSDTTMSGRFVPIAIRTIFSSAKSHGFSVFKSKWQTRSSVGVVAI